jgi:hypothetical protein
MYIASWPGPNRGILTVDLPRFSDVALRCGITTDCLDLIGSKKINQLSCQIVGLPLSRRRHAQNSETGS